MAQQTINVGAAPNDGTGTPLRTAFQYTNSNFSELYTAVGPSGNNIVVPGNATITGDLTVDTNVLKVDTTLNRVGIGTASPIAGSSLDVRGAVGTGTDIQSLTLIDTSALAINNGGGLSFGYVFESPSTVIGRAGYIKTIKENATDGNYASAMVFGVTANGAATAERYRIGSDGTSTWSVAGSTAMTLNATGLGVGGSPAAGVKLHVGGGNAHIRNAAGGQTKLIFGTSLNSVEMGGIIYDDTDGSVTFGTIENYATRFITNNTERGRFDASGNLLVGRTTMAGSERLHIEGSVTSFVSRFSNTSATTPSGLFVRYSSAAPNGTGDFFVRCDDNVATRFELRSNGGLANYSANNVNLSDARTKTDIKPLISYWNKIKALELVTFKYKDQTHDDDNIGLISQQVESVAPEFVSNDGFGQTPADGVPLKGIYTTDLYHGAIKALQEAMTRIEVLEAKLA